MNKWKKLDKNNLPSDIMVYGKYEFRSHGLIRMGVAGDQFAVRHAIVALAGIDTGRLIEYRRKAVEPFNMDGEILSCVNFVTMASADRYREPKTEITISFPWHITQEAVRRGQKVAVTITPIDN